jgi:hypothetical protein
MVIFEEGLHKTTATKKQWTKGDLQTVVEKTRQASPSRIPFVMRHPKNNLPVLGYTTPQNIRIGERGGKATIEAMPTEFAEGMLPALAASDLRYFSVSINPDMSLFHIGVTDNPAVKDIPGIDQYQFSANDRVVEIESAAEFADTRMNIVYSRFRKIKEWIIGKWGTDEANKVMPEDEIILLADERPEVPTYLTDTLNSLLQNQNNSRLSFEEPIMKEEIEQLQRQAADAIENMEKMRSEFSAAMDTERQQSKERESALLARNEELTKRVQHLTTMHQRQEFSAFVDELIREGKVIPAERDYTIDDLMLKAAVGNHQFSDGEKSAVEKTMEMLKNKQPLMQFSDMANPSRAGKQTIQAMDLETLDGRNALHAKIKEVAKTNNITFEAAYERVLEEVEQ